MTDKKSKSKEPKSVQNETLEPNFVSESDKDVSNETESTHGTPNIY